MADSRKLLLKESYNNVFDTAEILWLLKGNESLSALDFVCKYIVNISPEHLMDAFEQQGCYGKWGLQNHCSYP